ncbi:MAG: hypothetical protein NTY00_01510 [Deltaproteobacteria bacterium]|nr:hypothetical protein [Deltaproteobacteria bacterium]
MERGSGLANKHYENQPTKIGQPGTSADRVELLIFFCTFSGAVG